MAAAHASDPPTEQNEQSNIEGAIDPFLVESTSGGAKLPDDEQALKKTWLTLLPTEQVIEILMKLDESLPQDASIRKVVWPSDLKAAVFRAAVAKIVESSAGGSTSTSLNGSGKGDVREVVKSLESDEKKGAEGGDTTTSGPPPPATATTTSSTASPVPPTAPVPSATPVPPLTSTVRRPSPPTSTTTYQAAASSSFSSYAYPYINGLVSYQHSTNHHLPYSYSYSLSPSGSPSLSLSSPGIRPTSSSTPIPPSVPEDDDDLPSYEEMLVQALTVHNDPKGTAPKQLFQWMAATYPLQANFRPSASQALQKAYKRGRFEKNSEGRYRLNPGWEGGNTSRRTTRRPQSYSKAVLNPNPSSHPPANTSQFVPQHYTWTYGQGRGGKSQSPAPPLTSGLSPMPGSVPATPASAPTHTATAECVLEQVENVDADHEGHKICMEAAYSILQALNITSANVDANKIGNQTKTLATDATSTATSSIYAALDASNTSSSQTATALIQALPATAEPSTASSTSPSNRAALQGTLALLAAQLAELADGVSISDGQSHTQSHSVGTLNVNLLESMGIGLDMLT